MKRTKDSEFKIDAVTARNFAETRWGRGGTNSSRTTQKGFYYYSCSGHGGYVVDARSFTTEQLEILTECGHGAINAEKLIDHWIDPETNEEHKDVVKLFNPFSYRIGSYNGRFKGCIVRAQHPIYLFEEDCDWAIVEALTGVRKKWLLEQVTEEEYKTIIRKNLMRWNPKAYEVLTDNGYI